MSFQNPPFVFKFVSRRVLLAPRAEGDQWAVSANCRDSLVLVLAAGRGNTSMVQLLLTWEHHAPKANCRDGEALVAASAEGWVPVIQVWLPSLLGDPDFPGCGHIPLALNEGPLNSLPSILTAPCILRFPLPAAFPTVIPALLPLLVQLLLARVSRRRPEG